MWIVTMAVNAYEQRGNYFIAAYENRPTFRDLKKLLPDEGDVTLGKLTRGGGRQNRETAWYYLTEVKSGELYKSS